jgi:hypothetical protein
LQQAERLHSNINDMRPVSAGECARVAQPRQKPGKFHGPNIANSTTARKGSDRVQPLEDFFRSLRKTYGCHPQQKTDISDAGDPTHVMSEGAEGFFEVDIARSSTLFPPL